MNRIYLFCIFFVTFFKINWTFAQTSSAAQNLISPADTAWLLTASALVLLMTPGLSFFYGGMVRSKNIVSTMLQSYICMGIVSLIWICFGFSLAFGDSLGGIIGNPFTYFMLNHVSGESHPILSPTIPFILFALFQLKFAIITPALITGSFAERVSFKSYSLFVILFEIFIYAPLAHMTWHPDGFLHKLGVLDFAGGTVVHLSAGVAALSGAIFLGSRSKSGTSDLPHSPGNIPFVLLGTGLLWFGWFGFNAGSALAANATSALAFATTHFASAAAMIAWILLDHFIGKKPSAVGACIGAVVGLVAITPSAGYVSVGASVIIGSIAAIVSHFAVRWRTKSSLDDTLDVFPCHGVGGMTGMLLTGVFAKEGGLITGRTQLFLVHLTTLVAVTLIVGFLSYGLFWLVDQITALRVSKEDETIGLDRSQHDEIAVS